MSSIRLVKPFGVMHTHAGCQVHLDVAGYFDSSFPLNFKLLDSPDWLRLSEQGVMTGTVPMVKQDSQFMVTIAAWNNQDLSTQKFIINLVPEDMFDSLKKPMLVLSMMNKTYFPREKPPITREVLAYIFGYYHNKPHGEQVFAALREKANTLDKHLPDQLSLENFVAFFALLASAEQQILLESTVPSHVLETAMHLEPVSLNRQQYVETESLHPEVGQYLETAVLGFPAHENIPHEHTLLEYLYAHWEVTRSSVLQQKILEEAAALHLVLHGKTKFEQFKEVVTAKDPKLEEKLEALSVQHPLLKQVKLTDQELSKALNAELEREKYITHRTMFEFAVELELEKMEEQLGLVEEAVLQYRHEHPLDPLEFSYQRFYPHPTPYGRKE